KYVIENLDSAEKVAVAIETIAVISKNAKFRDEGVGYLKDLLLNRELPIGLRMVVALTSSVQGLKDMKKIIEKELPNLETEQDIITSKNLEMWRKNSSGEFLEKNIFQVYVGIKRISEHVELLPKLIFEEETPLVDQFIAGNLQRQSEKVGRNDPCTCGSGKKYKKCCGNRS
ncbi:MAG: YecA family protein, partial [Fusobacteriaceae bacterium]